MINLFQQTEPSRRRYGVAILSVLLPVLFQHL